jgi:hypothetical protein
MTTPDIELILDRWLGEGTDVLPDRSVDAVLRTLERTSQRSVWRVPWRTPTMNSNSRLGLLAGAAVIVVLVVGGLVILGGSQGPSVGGDTSPSHDASASPAPSAAPTVAPTPSPSETPLGAAIVNLDGTVRQDLDLPRSAWAPALAPDGSRVAYVDGGQLWVRAVAAGSDPQDIGATVTGAIDAWSRWPVEAAPAWSPDGMTIAYASNGDIYVAAADGSAPPRKLTTDPQLDEWPAWTPNGKTIYYVNSGAAPLDDSQISPTQEIWHVDASGGKPKRVTSDGVAELQPDFARDGTMAVWVGGTIWAMDPANGQTTNVTSQRDGASLVMPEGWNPRWSPDGSKLALLTYDSRKRTTFDYPASGLPSNFPLMQVAVVDLTTGDVGPRVAAFWNPVSWTPDSQALLVNRYDCVADGTGGTCP